MRETRTLNETHPDLCREWDYELNGDLTPNQITRGSKKQVWWKCLRGHSFSKSPYDRTNKKEKPDYVQCPHCSHVVPTPGEYSLATEFPNLLAEWDWEANERDQIDPDNISPHSHKVVHWKCPNCKGTWSEPITRRTLRNGHGTKCPYCYERRDISFKPGINDLATMCPELACQWSSKNIDSPENIHYGSDQRVWWVCEQGHEWEARISHRTHDKTGCPYCNGRMASPAQNLAAIRPDIAEEWDYEANAVLLPGKTPLDFLPNSAVIASWKCPNNPNHQYEMAIYQKIRSGCPYCSHHRILENESFAASYPDLLKEWDWEKNKELNPWNLAPGSGKIVWWKCSKGHEWKASIGDRVRRGTHCVECQPYGTSFAEQVFYFGVKKLFPEYKIENRYKTSFGKEIDIYINELKLGLEPGSWFWHAERLEYDTTKLKACFEHGIRLFVIYEDCPHEENPLGSVHYVFPKSFSSVKDGELYIRDIMKDIFAEYCFPEGVWNDETWHAIAYQARKHLVSLSLNNERSLAAIAPELVPEWSDKNELTPDEVLATSNKKAFWVCPKGHEYMKTPKNRISGSGCNICTNYVADPRYNTIKKLYPDYLQYLSENNEIDPDTVTPGNTTKPLKWTCPNCGEDFDCSAHIMFRGASTICPHCREKMPARTPFTQLDY